MDKETIIIIIVAILVIFAVLYTTGIISINIGKSGNSVGASGIKSSGNMPQECQAPAGQDINAWKEHLGHHENTKYCLDYYK